MRSTSKRALLDVVGIGCSRFGAFRMHEAGGCATWCRASSVRFYNVYALSASVGVRAASSGAVQQHSDPAPARRRPEGLAREREGLERVPPPERSLHILLVEDHLDTAAALSDLLGALGHRVTVANTVTEALAAAQREPPDLVVSDIGLPDGNGHELMRELVQRYGLHGVAVSGYGMEEDRRRSLAAGFDSHLTKPITVHQLRSAIARAADPGA